MLYILIAGGPCTGKTTLTKFLSKALEEQGFRVYVIRDWARELIKLGKERGGPLPWTDRVGFEIEVVRAYLADFRKAKRYSPDIVIDDGGPIAAIAYCRVDGVRLPKEIELEIVKHSKNVSLALLTEPIGTYFTDSERWEDLEYAVRIHREIIKVHLELLGDRAIKVPPAPRPELRAEKALEQVLKFIGRARPSATP